MLPTDLTREVRCEASQVRPELERENFEWSIGNQQVWIWKTKKHLRSLIKEIIYRKETSELSIIIFSDLFIWFKRESKTMLSLKATMC